MPDELVKTEVAISINGVVIEHTAIDLAKIDNLDTFIARWTFDFDGRAYGVSSRSVIIHTTDWTRL